MKIKKIHQVTYLCKGATQTAEWCNKYLNMEFRLAFSEELVSSTKTPGHHMHNFLDASAGNVLAFFEEPLQPEMPRLPQQGLA